MSSKNREASSNPFVPIEQQIEGLTSVLEKVSPQQFLHALDVMVRDGMMSKSNKHLLIKRMRHILGMTHEQYLNLKGKK